MSFNRKEVESLRDEIQNALEQIAKKHNLDFTFPSIRFGTDLNVKINFAKIESNKHGNFVMTKDAKTFLDKAEDMGLRKDCLNETYPYKGKKYKILGYSTRARKFPIQILETTNNEKQKCTEKVLKDIIKETRPELFL